MSSVAHTEGLANAPSSPPSFPAALGSLGGKLFPGWGRGTYGWR